MEFKKGDKVKIKQRCDIEPTDSTLFLQEMSGYCNRETYISKVQFGFEGGSYYYLNIDGGNWCWEGDWLELVEN